MNNIINGIAMLGQCLCITTPFYIIWMFARRFAAGRTEVMRNFLYIKEYTFYTYMIFLAMITGLLRFEAWSFDFDSLSFNLVPFRNEPVEFMLLNVFLFIPLGVLFPVMWDRYKNWKSTIFAGFFVSLAIEMIQMLFAGRLADVDDLMFNTIGATAGYGFYCFTKFLLAKYRKREIGFGTTSLFFNAASLLGGISYKGISLGEILFYQIGIESLSAGAYISRFVTILLAAIAFVICRRYPDQFMTKVGQPFAVFNLCLSLINLFI